MIVQVALIINIYSLINVCFNVQLEQWKIKNNKSVSQKINL